MEEMIDKYVEFEKTSESVPDPTYETLGSVGMDVTAQGVWKIYKGQKPIKDENLESIQKSFDKYSILKIRPFERVLISTGLKVKYLFEDYELQIRSRSGISLKRGLFVANSPGTIDSDYRGEIGVILYNSTPFLIEISKGERIAQIVINQVEREKRFIKDESERGEGGFGSTD